MFSKAFRVKSSTQLKVCERKRLKSDVAKHFPVLGESGLEVLFPNKETVTSNKVVMASGATVTVFCVQNTPILFEVEKILYPTVYMSWKLPETELKPTLQTIPQVFPKLLNGADLMLPGICTREGAPVNISMYGKMKKGDCVIINLITNKASHAVGVTNMSSEDMYMAAGRGKAVKVLHIAGDKLCDQWYKMAIPELGPPFTKAANGEPVLAKTLETVHLDSNDCDEPAVEVVSAKIGEEIEEQTDSDVNLDPGFVMDKLVEYCFLKVVCSHKVVYPILSSTFYRLHMIPASPISMTLDIKKSSYKKLSKFLGAMVQEGMISVADLVKGVESIMSVNVTHERIIKFTDVYDTPAKKDAFEKKTSTAVKPSDVYTVTAAVLPLFTPFGQRKGDTMPMVDARKYLTMYVKGNKLQSAQDPSKVVLDPILHSIYQPEAHEKEVPWPSLMAAVQGLMTHKFQLADANSTPKKFQPIDIQVFNRSGRKKVTIIHNLELYGIDIKEFSRKCQHTVAASTSVTTSLLNPKNGQQLQVQGNQVYYIGKILQEQYQIPVRYIRGLEKAIKPK